MGKIVIDGRLNHYINIEIIDEITSIKCAECDYTRNTTPASKTPRVKIRDYTNTLVFSKEYCGFPCLNKALVDIKQRYSVNLPTNEMHYTIINPKWLKGKHDD